MRDRQEQKTAWLSKHSERRNTMTKDDTTTVDITRREVVSAISNLDKLANQLQTLAMELRDRSGLLALRSSAHGAVKATLDNVEALDTLLEHIKAHRRAEWESGIES